MVTPMLLSTTTLRVSANGRCSKRGLFGPLHGVQPIERNPPISSSAKLTEVGFPKKLRINDKLILWAVFRFRLYTFTLPSPSPRALQQKIF